MNHRVTVAVPALCTVAVLMGSAHAQVGVNPVDSDAEANTAMGSGAMQAQLNAGNGSYYSSTAAGEGAMRDTMGPDNSAFGNDALAGFPGSLASGDTAIGTASMYFITNSSYNTGVGVFTLEYLSTGSGNTAIGGTAMRNGTTGSYNTAAGGGALLDNNGSTNSAFGSSSLIDNNAGNGNVALGYEALSSNTSGSYNIAIGNFAGSNIVGSNNIDIGNGQSPQDNGLIRLGFFGIAPATTTTYIAGIHTSKITGAAVFVNSAGKLGVLASSTRYKTSIVSMQQNPGKLRQLRPVTFHLKNDPDGPLQYGLIAEEVARIYPELVIRDAAGRVDGLRYDELDPLLLNEVHRQQAQMHHQAQALSELQQQLAELEKSNRVMQDGIRELLAQ